MTKEEYETLSEGEKALYNMLSDMTSQQRAEFLSGLALAAIAAKWLLSEIKKNSRNTAE